MKAQSNEVSKELRSDLSKQIQCFGNLWGTLLTELNNQECEEKQLACQVHMQLQELTTKQFKS
jgi:hypothetical protein